MPKKIKNFCTKNPFLGEYPLKDEEMRNLYKVSPNAAIFHSIDPSDFKEISFLVFSPFDEYFSTVYDAYTVF